MENKITQEQAVREFESWLDYKKIKEKQRNSNKEQEETIIDAIIDGTLMVDDEKNIIFKLNFPLESPDGDITVEQFVFKPRIKVFELNAKLKGVKSTDVDGRIMAYTAAITGQNAGVIKKIDTVDYSICQAIVMYFL